MYHLKPQGPGTRFNIKMLYYQYRKCHYGEKMILRLSYLHNGISCAGKVTSYIELGPWLFVFISGPPGASFTDRIAKSVSG